MSVLINFKICDNAEECLGIAVCTTGALSWNSDEKAIKIDNGKCISCGSCEKACGVKAIMVAKTDEEYKAMEKEIDDDPRKIADLIIDRYGAQPIHPDYLIPENDFNHDILKSTKLVAVEFFKNDTIECMIKSIPVKEILRDYDIKFRKMEMMSDQLMKKYEVSELPALLFFKDGKLLGKVEGYYQTDQKSDLKEKIKKILK